MQEAPGSIKGLKIEETGEAQNLKKGLRERLLTSSVGQSEFVDTSFCSIPAEWKIVTLQDVATRIMKGIFNMSPLNYVERGIPFLRISDIIENKVDLSLVKYIPEGTNNQFPSSQLTPGDIVLAKVGSAGDLDKMAIIPELIKYCNISQNLIGIKLDRSKVNPQYMFYFFSIAGDVDENPFKIKYYYT